MVYLVVRIKGTVNIPHWARLTLDNLHLNKRFRATLIPENEQSLGMLRKIKDIVSWSSIDEVFLREFIEKKGRFKESFSPPADSDTKVKSTIDLDKVVSLMSSNETHLSKISGIKPWFALNPPKGGFKKQSKKAFTQNGILGENKELVELVKRMM